MKLKIPMGIEQKFVPKVQYPDAVLTGGSYEQRLQYYPIVRFLGQKVSVAYFCEFSKKEYIYIIYYYCGLYIGSGKKCGFSSVFSIKCLIVAFSNNIKISCLIQSKR